MQVIILNRLDASKDILLHVDHIQIPRDTQIPVVLYVILNHLEAFRGISWHVFSLKKKNSLSHPKACIACKYFMT